VKPEPVPGRPVVSAFVRLARTAARIGLWVALAAEPPPAADDRQQIVRAPRVDADGHRVVDHAEGW
jgi:alkanesulfonate monooxygenase SsuD/methylene tetrahydromethanopterin reductase-like flavin-dependent oxidoreductase (luciferase family)